MKILKNLVLPELCWAFYLFFFTFQKKKKFFFKLSDTERFEILAKVIMLSGFLNFDPGSVNAIAYVRIWMHKYPICDQQTHDLDYIFVCRYFKISYRNLKNLFIWNENNIFWHNFAIVYKPNTHHVNHNPHAEAHRNLNRKAVDKADKATFCSFFLSENSYFRQVEQIYSGK